jgi:hypothetical protein
MDATGHHIFYLISLGDIGCDRYSLSALLNDLIRNSLRCLDVNCGDVMPLTSQR